MAPSQKDGAIKYKDWDRYQLEAECSKRKLSFKESATNDDLINMLIKDDKNPPNWGKVYAQLMRQYHMDYDSIMKRTIPQILALNMELPEQLAIDRMTIPGIFGGALDNPPPSPTGKPPKLSEFMAFANAFNDT